VEDEQKTHQKMLSKNREYKRMDSCSKSGSLKTSISFSGEKIARVMG